MKELLQQWLDAKEAERASVEKRRAIEDRLSELLASEMPADGQKTIKAEGFAVKVTSRITYKVNGEALQEIASKKGVPLPILQQAFKWKCEVIGKGWNELEKGIQSALSDAVTTEKGRPSYQITINTKEGV